MLDGQHAQYSAILNQRYAEESVILLFVHVLDQMEPRMAGRVFQVQRFLAFGHQPDQSLLAVQAHTANGARIQAGGGHQDVLAIVFVGQIEGTGGDVHRIPNLVDRDCQRAGQIRRGADILNDTAQSFEHVAGFLPAGNGSKHE